MPSKASKRAHRVGLVILGILAGQLILYGASFTGAKILLPLDILAPGEAHNRVVTDPILEDEPARIFRHAELRAGRVPIWNPYQYAGTPSMSFLSPFAIFGASVRSPLILPWVSLSLALVSGFGMYVFARRVLEVNAWPGIVAAWCYPVTGFFVLWQSTSLPYPVVWLPWLLWSIHAVLSGSKRWALPALALITMLTLVSGHVDMAGLVLTVGVLFAIWASFFGVELRAQALKNVYRFTTVLAGLALGIMLASPELLPAIEYAKTGSRFEERTKGHEERPPIGLVSLPQLVLPHIYGTAEKDTITCFPENEANLAETPAAGFTGLIASLILAPLAFTSRHRRALTTFLSIIVFLGMAWCLNAPGIVWLMRLPVMNLLSYNRFVFASSFGIVALAMIGIDESLKGRGMWRRYHYVPLALLAGIMLWCVFRIFVPPKTIGVSLPQIISSGLSMDWVRDMDAVHRVQRWFTAMYLSSVAICLTTLVIWVSIRFKKGLPKLFFPALGLLAFGECLFFAYGRASQCDPELYYPPLAVFDEIAHSSPGRTIGYKCFQASLLQTHALFDVRGYDGVDPAGMVDLLGLAAAPDSPKLDYAATQYFTPRILAVPSPESVQLSPVLDLLGVRYVIFPPETGPDYLVRVNQSALPRVFVPQSLEVEANKSSRLAKLGSADFDPRRVAYLETPIDSTSQGQGEVNIVEATSQRITVRAKMIARGLVVLADQWNDGWRAYIGDKVVSILRVDHALSGVVAPAGESTIVFRYQPISLRLGLGMALIAALILIVQSYLLRRA